MHSNVPLPRSNAQAPAISAPRTLVVDDVSVTRLIIGRMLEKLGHLVTVAKDGAEALELMRGSEAPFDLVMLDIEMPVLDGVTTLRHIKRDPTLAAAAVVMISSIEDVEVIASCIELGAEDYLGKPFQPRIMEARVNSSRAKKRLHEREQHFTRLLEEEEARSERLIASMLPAHVAERLKRGETSVAETHEDVSVVFADIVGFTARAAGRTASAVVSELNLVFSLCDELAGRYQLQKIKTIGDAYLAVGGIAEPRAFHLEQAAAFARELVSQLRSTHAIELRIGVHAGPIVAGVIGTRRPAYDVWGDTVNTASRLCDTALPGTIQVSQAVAARLAETALSSRRGSVELKGLGAREVFVLAAEHPEPRAR